MRRLTFRGGVITRFDKYEIYNDNGITKSDIGNAGTEYLIRGTSFDNIDEIAALSSRGYSFLDRVLGMKIDIKSTEEVRQSKLKLLPGIEFNLRNECPNEVADIADNAFVTDRRFHLEEHYDSGMAHEIIVSYIREYINAGGSLYTASYNGRIVGFIIMIEESPGVAHNVLGAVLPEITGRAVAYPMYCTFLNELQKQGYKEYIGIVSSSNITSINLHIQLGAYVTEVTDEYILRRK